jgi:hypothetical protein
MGWSNLRTFDLPEPQRYENILAHEYKKIACNLENV